MGMNLPGELVWVLEILGFDWPPLDEDEIRRGADMVRQFSSDIEAEIEKVHRQMNDGVQSAMSAATATSLSNAWNSNREQNLSKLADILDPAAGGMDIFADTVVALKLKVIAELGITAAQIAAAIASAVVTFGLGAAAQAALILARKKAMDIIVEQIVGEVAGRVLVMIVTPLMDDALRLVAAILEAPLVEGSVGDVSEFQADFAALEQTANEMDAAGRDQASIAQEFFAQIQTLQIVTE